MKKLFLIAVCIVLVFVIASCADEVSISVDEVKLEPTSEFREARRAELLELAALGSYEMTEEEIIKSLEDLLKPDDSSKNLDSVVYSVGKVVATDSVIIGSDCKSKALSEEGKNKIALLVYEINKQNGDEDPTTGYAITSNDRRIGDVLCFVDDGDYLADIGNEENTGMKFFQSCLKSYVDDTNDIWNSFTDEEIEQAKTKLSSEKGLVYSRKLKEGSKSYLLTTEWGQKKIGWSSYRYNDAIKAVYGKDYCTGCVPTAIAQVMAYHKWPKSISSTYLNTLKKKWSNAKSWNGVYNWSDMKDYSEWYYAYLGTYWVKNVHPSLGALMYDLAESCQVSYGVNGTGAYNSDAIRCFKNHGYSVSYTYSNAINWAANIVKNNKRPVFMTGTEDGGHAYVLDGYYKETVKEILPSRTYTRTYVHINYGWNGDSNGWYKDGIIEYGNNTFAIDAKPNK